MTLQPITRLHKDLASIQKILLESRILSFAAETQQSYLSAARQLEERLQGLSQNHLFMGLLGGTGVGKSTLMNALAGSPITSADHRRPHTDRVLIYHYAGQPLPAALIQNRVPWQAISHDAEEIRHLVLCDLPDFDSLVAANREAVLSFLEYLDVLVWVTSPEKYADASFYEFLAVVPKAREHFVFVLNKADLLFAADMVLEQDHPEHRAPGAEMPAAAGEGSANAGVTTPDHAADGGTGYVALEKLISRFQEHISHHGLIHPILYAVSAQQVVAAQTPSSWNQFATFRRHVFQQREIKDIMAIKAANLDEEVRRLVDAVRSELATHARAAEVLQQLGEALAHDVAEWMVSGRLGMGQWIERSMTGWLDQVGDATTWLWGPGRLLAVMGSEWRRWRRTGYGSAANPPVTRSEVLFPKELDDRLRGQLDHIEHRLANDLMRQGLPANLTDRLLQGLGVEAAWQQFILRINDSIEACLRQAADPPRGWRLVTFRGQQLLAYGLLLTLFLVVAGGDRNWSSLLQHPTWSSFAGVVLTVFGNLFSPSGLAALVSLGILSLLLGLQFLHRHKKLLQRHHRTIIDALKTEVGKHWEDVIRRVVATLAERRQELEQPVVAFSQFGRESLGE
ncbi:MAG TPA: hypothetical protein DEO88_09435 [Syntrophobacteraceae bacterium]|nr:hypothetical protein [Syntrophobacteraceae bacterium]